MSDKSHEMGILEFRKPRAEHSREYHKRINEKEGTDNVGYIQHAAEFTTLYYLKKIAKKNLKRRGFPFFSCFRYSGSNYWDRLCRKLGSTKTAQNLKSRR